MRFDARASDYIMLDVMKIGGVSGWLRAIALVDAHLIRVSSHLCSEVSAELLCSTPTADWLEYADWWNPLLSKPLEILDGMAVPGTEPGAGVDWNEKGVQRYLA